MRPRASDVPHLGLSLAPASDVAGAGDTGVVVMNVEPEGPAAEQGFQRGNVILDVGGKPVANVGDVRNALKEAKTNGKHTVLMRVRNGRRHQVRRRAARQCLSAAPRRRRRRLSHQQMRQTGGRAVPVPSRANALAGGRAETWCIRDRAGVTSEICAFSSADDCIGAAAVGPAGGIVCAPQTRRPVGNGRRVASPSGNFRPRFGHAPERSGKRSKKAQH